jgi:dye decolorizing peroxidase
MVSRRGFLASTAATAAVAGIGVASGAASASFIASQNSDTATARRSLEFYGSHQMGIEADLQAVTNFVALDLKPGMDAAAMLRWMDPLDVGYRA